MDLSNYPLPTSLNPTSYRDIAQSLEAKSNVKMEDEMVNDFRTRVLRGDF